MKKLIFVVLFVIIDCAPKYTVIPNEKESNEVKRRWTPKTGQGAKLYVRLLKGGTDYGKN